MIYDEKPAENRVLALWLDSMDVDLVERMMDGGELPHLAALRARGIFGLLENDRNFSSECSYGMILTGCFPERTRRFAFRNFDPATYRLADKSALDYRMAPAFFDLPRPFKVGTFDLPQSPLLPNLDGIQIANWGSHSAAVDPGSIPKGLLEEITTRHGEHPAGDGSNYANVDDPDSLTRLFEDFVEGIRKRTAVIEDLWEREESDLLFACISEPHNAGHYFWPRQDCDEEAAACGGRRFIEDIYREIDASVGKLSQSVGSEGTIFVFSVEGMRSNCEDLASTVFLPELLARHFLDCDFFDFADGELYPNATDYNWVTEIWRRHIEPEQKNLFLRRFLSPNLAARIECMIGLRPALFHPSTAPDLNYQPPTWYQPYWSQMRAFALPSNSQGFIRINVRGRERHGKVAPVDYQGVCDEIEELLTELRNPETGEPAVLNVVRTRPDSLDLENDGSLTPADLVVEWHPSLNATLESPRYGKMGPVPYLRSGGHTPHGFLAAAGPGIPPGVTSPGGRVVDLGATIRGLLGVEKEQGTDGSDLFSSVIEGDAASIPPITSAGKASNRREKLAMVMCVRNEERFLPAHLLYHRALGVDRAYVFLDDCSDSTRDILSRFNWVHITEISLEERPEHLVDLQCLCMDYAFALSRRDGMDWLMTIDPDEFAFAGNSLDQYGNDDGIPERWRANLTSMLAEVPSDVEMVSLKTVELIPGSHVEDTQFWKQKDFWKREPPPRKIAHAGTGKVVEWEGFLGHSEGKCIVRTSAKVQAYDSHRWVPDQDCIYPDRPSFVAMPTPEVGFHLHYLITSANHWREKYRKLSIEPDHWPCGSQVEIPKQYWKEVATILPDDDSSRYYDEWIASSSGQMDEYRADGRAVSLSVVRKVLEENDFLRAGMIRLPAPGPERGVVGESISQIEDLIVDTRLGPRNIVELGKVPTRLLTNAYPVEQMEGKLFRWLSTEPVVQFEMQPGAYRVKLNMGDLCGMCRDLTAVELNDHPIEKSSFKRLPDGFEFFVPSSLFQRDGKQKLALTFPPVDTKGWPGEDRTLGAPVFNIRFEPEKENPE